MTDVWRLVLVGLLSTVPLALVAIWLMWFHWVSKMQPGWVKRVILLDWFWS